MKIKIALCLLGLVVTPILAQNSSAVNAPLLDKEKIAEMTNRCISAKTSDPEDAEVVSNVVSGFIVGHNLVVLPFHLLKHGSEIFVNANKVPARLLRIDTLNDLVLAGAEVKDMSPIKLAEADPEVLSRVIYVGSPLDMKCVFVPGFINGYTPRYLIANNISQPGTSGSAVYNEAGKLVGMASRIVGSNVNGGWFSNISRASAIRKLLEGVDLEKGTVPCLGTENKEEKK